MRDLTLPAAPLASTPPEPEPSPQPRPEVEAPDLDSLSDCRYCWGKHPGVCPFIRSIEWHPSGQIARVILKDRAAHEKAVVYAHGDEEETDTKEAPESS